MSKSKAHHSRPRREKKDPNAKDVPVEDRARPGEEEPRRRYRPTDEIKPPKKPPPGMLF